VGKKAMGAFRMKAGKHKKIMGWEFGNEAAIRQGVIETLLRERWLLRILTPQLNPTPKQLPL
jgi:hypothetical protein